MHNSYPAPRIRDRLQLIPPTSDGERSDNAEDAFGRCDGRRDTQQRILLVEDEFLLSAVLAADLQTAGYEVLGPCATVSAAMDAVQSQSFDGAILDINLKGELVYPVAEELARRRIPYMFLSGYELANMPERFRPVARVRKPADPAVVLREVQNLLRANRDN